MQQISYTSKREDMCFSEISIYAALEQFKTYVSVTLPIT